jgi:DNA-binding transcriptional ArsR family regulator
MEGVGAEVPAVGGATEQVVTEQIAAEQIVAEPVDEVLAALADPTRRRLLDVLAARGAASATELAGELPVTRQAVVKHLAVLDAAGLVTGRRLGRRNTLLTGDPVVAEQLACSKRSGVYRHS